MAETLICLLILLMVTGIIAAAIPTASDVYKGAVDAANAQVLESTAVIVLRDELSTAKDVLVSPADGQENESVIMYRTGETGNWNKIVSTHKTVGDAAVNEIKIYEYGEAASVNTSFTSVTDAIAGVTYDVEDGRYLVSQKATTQNLSISFSGVAYDQATGVITITGLRVFRGDSVKPIAERATLAIKTSNINRSGGI